MTTIKCSKCGNEIELTEALKKEIEGTVIAGMEKKQLAEIEEIKKKALEEAGSKTDEIMKKIIEDAEADKKEMRDQMKGLIEQIRELTKAKDNAEINAEKKLLEKENAIREEAKKTATEEQRMNLAAKNKTITDLQKALDDAQRKASQGSQQLQGEVMELDFEKSLADEFRDDDLMPVAKGTKGGDILQVVKSSRGTVCGVMLWEIKRTKNWTEGWVAKLKEDLRSAKANIPIIITEVMPKDVPGVLALYHGVWVCKPGEAVILATLLRKSLIDAGRQKALAENRGSKADLLYGFVTSHEFAQQIEGMVETFKEMGIQIENERVAFEKQWSQRGKQAQRLLMGTANIIGSMQGHIGQASMPKIKGLELLESGDEAEHEEASLV